MFSGGIKMERLLRVLVRSICILYPGSTVLAKFTDTRIPEN